MKIILSLLIAFAAEQAMACSVILSTQQANELSNLFSSKDVKKKLLETGGRIVQVVVENNAYIIQTTGVCNIKAIPSYEAPEYYSGQPAACPRFLGFKLESRCENFRD